MKTQVVFQQTLINLLMLRNAFNILESLTKIRIIVFRRVWAHIIFTNNISNLSFLSKRKSHIQRDKKRCDFQENQFSYWWLILLILKLKFKWFLWGFYDSCPSGSVFGLPDHFLIPNHGDRPVESAGWPNEPWQAHPFFCRRRIWPPKVTIQVVK